MRKFGSVWVERRGNDLFKVRMQVVGCLSLIYMLFKGKKLLNNEIENMKKKVIMKINGHEVIEADLRPLGSKHDKMCINCGITGLRELKKRKCEA